MVRCRRAEPAGRDHGLPLQRRTSLRRHRWPAQSDRHRLEQHPAAHRLRLQPGPSTVVRAGYGVFYGAMPVRRLGSIGFDTSTPWINSLDGLVPTNYLSNPFPQGFNLSTGSRDPLTNVGFNIDSTARSNPIGHTQQWSLSLERQIGDRLPSSSAYLGNRGTNLQSGAVFQQNSLEPHYIALGNQLNELVPNPFYGIIRSGPLSSPTVAQRQLLLPYPQYTAVTQQFPNANVRYHGMVVKAERRLNDGLTFLGSYVWSKLIDDGSEPVGGPADPELLRSGRRARFRRSTRRTTWWRALSTTCRSDGTPFGQHHAGVGRGDCRRLDRSTIARWQSGFP